MTLVALSVLLLAAVLSPAMCRLSARMGGLFVSAVPLALGLWFTSSWDQALSGKGLVQSWQWMPDLGLDLAFRVDGLALTFALLICFIGSGVLLYASSYLGKSPRLGTFLCILTTFMFAMLGLVLADNLLLLFVFWELTSITSFLLIGFEHERERARWASVQALLTTGLGGLSLLAAVVLLGIVGGTWSISELSADVVLASPMYVPIAVLVLLAAFTKSAIFPFHYWLPNAMEAPSPVSALLHSATMVKAGVYLVARLNPTMSGPAVWNDSLIIFGGVTMVLGAFLATRRDEIKKILAYSTVSSLGILVMLLGLGAAKAAGAYLLAHAMFKGCLFLVAGSVSKSAGTKYPEQLGGLVTRSPVLGVTALLAALSMAGMFPLLGFVGKELMLKAGLGHPHRPVVLTAAIAVAGALTVLAAIVVGVRPFFLRPSEDARVQWDQPPGWRQLTLPVVLAAGGLIAALVPGWFAEPLVGGMVSSITPVTPPGGESPVIAAGKAAHGSGEVRLRWLELLWPATTATYLSIAALLVGTGLFVFRRSYRRATDPAARLERFGPARGYDLALTGLTAGASWHTRIVQNGSLQSYVRVMLTVIVAVVSAALLRSFDWDAIGLAYGEFMALEVFLIASLVLATISSVMQKSALATVACLSGVGFVIAMLFALYGAPDLAMTQFAVETLLLIIFVLVLFHLPRYRNLSSRRTRALDLVLASLFGTMASLSVLAVLAGDPPSGVSDLYADRSVPEGYGRNVVNVILVDFRAMDTLGEIFVIGVAGIGVYTLLRLRTKPRSEEPS